MQRGGVYVKVITTLPKLKKRWVRGEPRRRRIIVVMVIFAVVVVGGGAVQVAAVAPATPATARLRCVGDKAAVKRSSGRRGVTAAS